MTNKDFSFIEFEGIPAALEAGKQIASQDVFEIAGIPAVRYPDKYTLKLFPELAPSPGRTAGIYAAQDVEGFCEYVHRFKTPTTVIFHELSTVFVRAVLDYHGPDAPGWCDHHARLQMPESQQFKKWTQKQMFDQHKFGEFIESNISDIAAPPAGELLEAALNFSQTTETTFTSARRLQDGQAQITYAEKDKGKAQVQIPSVITLGIPIFEGGELYRLQAYLRYRIKNANLVLWFEVAEMDQVKRTAVEDINSRVAEDLAPIPMYAGTPGPRPIIT